VTTSGLTDDASVKALADEGCFPSMAAVRRIRLVIERLTPAPEPVPQKQSDPGMVAVREVLSRTIIPPAADIENMDRQVEPVESVRNCACEFEDGKIVSWCKFHSALFGKAGHAPEPVPPDARSMLDDFDPSKVFPGTKVPPEWQAMADKAADDVTAAIVEPVPPLDEIEKRNEQYLNAHVKIWDQDKEDRATLLRILRSRTFEIDREELAKWFYDRLPSDHLGRKPGWVPNGNSFKQDEARRSADALIASGRLVMVLKA